MTFASRITEASFQHLGTLEQPEIPQVDTLEQCEPTESKTVQRHLNVCLKNVVKQAKSWTAACTLKTVVQSLHILYFMGLKSNRCKIAGQTLITVITQ